MRMCMYILPPPNAPYCYFTVSLAISQMFSDQVLEMGHLGNVY